MRFGYLSTYPPTHCGLATFTVALRDALTVGHGAGPVISAVERPTADRPAGVVGELLPGDPDGPRRVAALFAECDAVIVQHEYGIYGGEFGDEIVAVLDALRVPTLVVLHTVLARPTPVLRTILERVVERAGAVVTMTTAARDHLAAGYDVDLGKVHVIPHGAPETAAPPPASARPGGRPPTVLTWGLLGPGKGIEWGIEAMALLTDLQPAPHYLVAGQTHPKVALHEGEIYRDALLARAERLGVAGAVTLDGRYRDTATLAGLVRTADVVLLPYDSTPQVTSGVLIEAVAARVPVVATRFPHAVELLGDGAGLLVDHRDPAGIAAALRAVLTRPEVGARMTELAGAVAPSLSWSSVAGRYAALAATLTGAPRSRRGATRRSPAIVRASDRPSVPTRHGQRAQTDSVGTPS